MASESEAMILTDQISAVSERHWKSLQVDGGKLPHIFQKQLIADMADQDVRFEKLITSLNINCKHLLTQEMFQFKLVTASNRTSDLLKSLYELEGDQFGFGFDIRKLFPCCGPPSPYGGIPQLAAVCQRLKQKVSSCTSTFSLHLNLQGSAAIGGQTGANVLWAAVKLFKCNNQDTNYKSNRRITLLTSNSIHRQQRWHHYRCSRKLSAVIFHSL